MSQWYVFIVLFRVKARVHYPQTDEQAPLPAALAQLLERVRVGLASCEDADFVFNCQMGRGRTTTGMVTACLISTTTQWVHDLENDMLEARADDEESDDRYDPIDGPSEEEAYLQGKHGRNGCVDHN